MTAGTDGEPVVLVAEDDRNLADTFEIWLDERYDVRLAYNGGEAIDAWDPSVDVALLDRRMPVEAGEAVLEHIREHDSDCAVAMVTAVDPDFDVFELGFDEYLVKPVEREELLALVESLQRRRQYDAEIRRHYRLTTKVALMEEHKTRSELAGSAVYQQLLDELAALDASLSSAAREMDPEDIGAVLREGP